MLPRYELDANVPDACQIGGGRLRRLPLLGGTRFGQDLVYAIAHNRLLDFYRGNGRASFLSNEESESVLEDTPAAEIAADLRLDRKRAVERLLAALGELPDPQREAFLLQQESDMSIEEIAAATGVGPETAKSRLRYAVAKLRASLGKQS